MSIRGQLLLSINDEARTIPLDTPRFTMGRGQENSLCIQTSVVSRSHAELIRIGDLFMLRDLGSTNGSYVNNTRVSEQILNHGDIVRFGANGPEMTFSVMQSESGRIAAEHHQHTGNLIDSLTGKLKLPQEDACEDANLRRVLAEAHLSKGNPERALDILSKYAETSNLSKLPEQFRASLLVLRGQAYLELKQLDQARDLIQQCLFIYQNLEEGKGDDTGVATAYSTLARILINSAEFLPARDCLHRGMLAARRAGNVRLRAEMHLMMGKLDWKEGDFDGASYNWNRAAKLSEETRDPHLQGRVQLQLALILYTEGRLKEAVPVYQKAIEQLEAADNLRLLLKAYSSLSRVLTRLGSWSATAKLLDERLEMARKKNLSKAEAVALTDMAELKLLQGDLPSSLKTIEEAIRIHGQTVYARTQRIYGRILHAYRKPDEAIDAYQKGLAAARKRGSIEEQILIELELSLIFSEKGDAARALKEIETAEAAASLDPALNLMARALYARGVLFGNTGSISDANRCFSQSLSIFQNIEDPYRTAICHSAIGSLRIGQQRLESARAHLEEAQRLFAKLGAMRDLAAVDELLSSAPLAEVSAAMTTLLPQLSNTARLSLSRKTSTGMLVPAAMTQAQRILLAVAGDEIAAMLKRGLEVENYSVERVLDGREALVAAISDTQTFDLLLLDALLEHRSGFDICRELRNRKRETPVILLGGRQGLEDKIEALQSGADDFLSKKNMVFEELMAKIEALLR